jgi:hypothetical protein
MRDDIFGGQRSQAAAEFVSPRSLEFCAPGYTLMWSR